MVREAQPAAVLGASLLDHAGHMALQLASALDAMKVREDVDRGWETMSWQLPIR